MNDTNHRPQAAVLALLVFSLMWAAVAARPWVATTPDPRMAILNQRAQRLRAEAKIVEQIVAQRNAEIANLLTAPAAQTAAGASPPPPARVVELPPITTTRSS